MEIVISILDLSNLKKMGKMKMLKIQKSEYTAVE